MDLDSFAKNTEIEVQQFYSLIEIRISFDNDSVLMEACAAQKGKEKCNTTSINKEDIIIKKTQALIKFKNKAKQHAVVEPPCVRIVFASLNTKNYQGARSTVYK